MENIGLANSLMEALASADPGEKKPSPLLAWTEQRLRVMLESAVPAKTGRVGRLRPPVPSVPDGL